MSAAMLDSSPPPPSACGPEVITMCSVGPLEGVGILLPFVLFTVLGYSGGMQ